MGVLFKTNVTIKPPQFYINYQTPCLLIGSCFSDHIGGKLSRLKFPILQNPFGVLYNPASIAKALEVAVYKTKIDRDDLIQYNNQWHSFLFHGSFSNKNIEHVVDKTNISINETHHFLKQAKYLFVTFGTAWVYQYKENNLIVSNCHKIPSDKFDRYRLSVSEISNNWTELIELLKIFNPELKIIFTVSPIRHLKDGAHENQISKSTLFLAIESLIQKNRFDHLDYFPSYEIIHDELRDYRFYADDMVHISEKGIEYIFEKFNEKYFTSDTKTIKNNVNSIIQATEHRILNENQNEIQNFATSMLNKIEIIEKKHSFIKLSLEKSYFENL